MLSSKSRITNCIILAILAFSTLATSLAYAAPLANNGKDWQYTNGNSWAWNYSPQTQINKDNIDQLEVKWLLPIASRTEAAPAIQALNPTEGVNTPPIVKNGLVYVKTNFMRTYAVDAKTGKTVWTNDYVINVTEARARLNMNIGGPHLHGFRYWEAGDQILAHGMACDFYGLDAKTGQTKVWVKDLCLNVPGQAAYAKYGFSTNNLNNIGTYEKGRQFIITLSGADATSWTRQARSVVFGISMDAPYNILWRVFNSPPQDVPVKDWALQECNIGYFRNIPCSTVAEKNRAGLEWDWAPVPDQPIHPSSSVTVPWGQPVIDEAAGFVYLNTGNQTPWSNLSLTPGPRLYGSTIMAIDMNKGERVWWNQPQPHDPYDYDCNWSGMLVENPTLGKVYVKGCKEGIFYVMDAATGKPKYSVDALEESYPGKKTYHLTDPLSYYDLREWGWPEGSKYHPTETEKIMLVPSHFNGAFATDMSYDGSNTMFHWVAMVPQYLKTYPLIEGGRGSVYSPYPSQANATIVARDITTGKMKWSWFYPFSAQRSHLTATSDIVFAGFTDGYVRFFNKDTGTLLRELNLGTGIITGATIGQDSAGSSKIFVAVGGSNPIVAGQGLVGMGYQFGNVPKVPGTLVAIGLSDRAAAVAKTTTVTTTQATTITTTSISTSTTTSVSTSATTLTTATTQTLTTTSATTITSTQAPQTQTTTVTSSAPAQTTTIVSSVTETTGLPSEVTYAAVGVAVIALIAAAVLVMRKK